MDFANDIEARQGRTFTLVERIEEDRQEEMERAGESHLYRAAAGAAWVTASVAIAPCASTASAPAEKLVKTSSKPHDPSGWKQSVYSP